MELKAGEKISIELVSNRPVPIKGRRRNLGRQARKRRKKYLEIEAAASAFVSAAAAASVQANRTEPLVTTSETGRKDKARDSEGVSIRKATILPSDRGYVLDDVRRQTVLSEGDRHDLMRQLGYLPGNALRVVARVEDAFSSEELEGIFAAAALQVTVAMPKTKAATQVVSAIATDRDAAPATNDSNNTDQHSENDLANDTDGTTSCNEMQKNEMRTKMMASMIQTMLKEPLVIKLYPLALRDESSSTKRRRKRRRDETQEPEDHHSTNTNTTVAENSSTGTMGTRANATNNASGTTVALPKSTPLMEPFPTIYWVTHPLIKALISKLELDRVNVEFEQRLLEQSTPEQLSPNKDSNKAEECCQSSPLASMKRAHMSYGKERRGLLSLRDMDYVKGRRWFNDSPSPKDKTDTAPFSDGCGVAGIRNPKAVKCLHAHAAHFWSGNSDNVVGRWVWERLKSARSFFHGSKEDQSSGDIIGTSTATGDNSSLNK